MVPPPPRTVARSKPEVRPFAWTMLAAASLGAYLLHRRGAPPTGSALLAGAGLLLLALAYFAPAVVAPVERAWSALGHALGRVTTPVLLVFVFALVLVPTRLVLRLLGKDPLELRRDPSRASYWTERARTTFDRDDFERLS